MKHELCARGGSLKNPACPHSIVQAILPLHTARTRLAFASVPLEIRKKNYACSAGYPFADFLKLDEQSL